VAAGARGFRIDFNEREMEHLLRGPDDAQTGARRFMPRARDGSHGRRPGGGRRSSPDMWNVRMSSQCRGAWWRTMGREDPGEVLRQGSRGVHHYGLLRPGRPLVPPALYQIPGRLG
jgi:hypothetical protein